MESRFSQGVPHTPKRLPGRCSPSGTGISDRRHVRLVWLAAQVFNKEHIATFSVRQPQYRYQNSTIYEQQWLKAHCLVASPSRNSLLVPAVSLIHSQLIQQCSYNFTGYIPAITRSEDNHKCNNIRISKTVVAYFKVKVTVRWMLQRLVGQTQEEYKKKTNKDMKF
jgi:hypothetical protein